jgi:glycosyltransferase involved in cell wall biosynthesis
MHVIQLTDFYRPFVGGLERHVQTLSTALRGLGHTVTVVTLRLADDQPECENDGGVRIRRVRGWTARLPGAHADGGRPFHPTVPDPGVVSALRRIVREERPDVVHSQSWMQYSYFPLHHPGSPRAHVVTLNDYGLACPKKTLQRTGPPAARSGIRCTGPGPVKCLACAPAQYGAVRGALISTSLRAVRPLHRRADRYIAISSAVADGSRAGLPDPGDVAVIPTMVPDGLPELAARAPRPGFLPPRDGYLMFAGALGPHKGVDVLLAARRLMREPLPLVIIGTPHPGVSSPDEPGVTVALDVPFPQVMAAWRHAGIAVVPSVWQEPLGQVAVEAALAGRPVVASGVGGLRDVVAHGETGLLVPPGDPAALARALDELAADPARRARLGAAARRVAARFEAAAVTPGIVEIYRDALARRVRADRRRR